MNETAMTGKPMELQDMAKMLKGMKSEAKNNLLFLMTGMELQKSVEHEGERKEEAPKVMG